MAKRSRKATITNQLLIDAIDVLIESGTFSSVDEVVRSALMDRLRFADFLVTIFKAMDVLKWPEHKIEEFIVQLPGNPGKARSAYLRATGQLGKGNAFE